MYNWNNNNCNMPMAYTIIPCIPTAAVGIQPQPFWALPQPQPQLVQPSRRKKDINCYICHRTGHKKKNCFWRRRRNNERRREPLEIRPPRRYRTPRYEPPTAPTGEGR
uniref:CCHC-type domain-containing protein n=1 Tax=Schizaphis graminum TaxID=13262 RepID=A0A2S2NKI2_SCHGA